MFQGTTLPIENADMPRHFAVSRPRFSWRQLDLTSRWLFPFVLLLLGLFVIGMPFGLPGQAELRPVYAMACVYFWSLYRPTSLPAPLVAITGLLLDLLGFSPFGLWAVLLLLLQAATLKARQKLAPAPFLYVWGGFVLLAVIGSLLAWLATDAFSGLWLPLSPLFTECLWAVGFYPGLASLLIRAHRGLAAIELA